MKNKFCIAFCFFTNIFVGAVGFLLAVLVYAFMFEANNNHSVQLGVICLLAFLVLLLLPNVIFFYRCKFNIKKALIYQGLPIIFGMSFYYIFQVCIL